jgi:hypothetical protein
MSEQVPVEEREAIHSWFGLSYCNYLVLHRTILQSMPDEWQERFVACLHELDDAAQDLAVPARYNVRVLAREPEWIYHETCPECEGSFDSTGCEGCDGSGEVECQRKETPEEVGFTFDPIPHYDRGRARVELRV